MIRSELRRIYHIARTDFGERARSRTLVAFLVVVAYIGYLVNVGFIQLTYSMGAGTNIVHVVGRPTAAMIGVKTALTGSLAVVIGAFYIMRTGIEQDRRHGHGSLVASSETSNAVYLLGKLVSNVALGGVVLATLAIAAVLNHLVHGVGGTDLVAIVTPLLVIVLPLCVLVGGVALLFETVPLLNGTAGTVCHLLLVFGLVNTLGGAVNTTPSGLTVAHRTVDILGYLPVYQVTYESVLATVPEYEGGPPALATFITPAQSFSFTGGTFPPWVYVHRLAVALAGVAVTLVGAVSFDRFRTGGGLPRLGRMIPSFKTLARLPALFGSDDSAADIEEDPRPVEDIDTTPVERRDQGGLLRLIRAEVQLAVRDRQWWWYAALPFVIVGPLALAGAVETTGSGFQFVIATVILWPLPAWRELGSRMYIHGAPELVFSSRFPRRQLLVEWFIGGLVGLLAVSGVATVVIQTGSLTLLVGVIAGALFPPSLALAIGAWLRSPRLFEASFLLLWYGGPINGLSGANFIGGNGSAFYPAVYLAGGAVLVGTALFKRTRETS